MRGKEQFIEWRKEQKHIIINKEGIISLGGVNLLERNGQLIKKKLNIFKEKLTVQGGANISSKEVQNYPTLSTGFSSLLQRWYSFNKN
jgi:hypothetical protein